jgi:PAS domain S-box-containing protein
MFELLAGTLDGAFAVDRSQRVVFWNAAAGEILGFDPEAVVGRPCYEVLGGTDESGCLLCESACALFRASLRGELSPTRSLRVRTSRGERKRVCVTTFLVPSRFQDLSLLAHVFRETPGVEGIAAGLERALLGPALPADLDVPAPPVGRLTPAERRVLRLLACGATTRAIGARLRVRPTTVRTHVQHLLSKLGVHTRLEAVALAAREGLLESPES